MKVLGRTWKVAVLLTLQLAVGTQPSRAAPRHHRFRVKSGSLASWVFIPKDRHQRWPGLSVVRVDSAFPNVPDTDLDIVCAPRGRLGLMGQRLRIALEAGERQAEGLLELSSREAHVFAKPNWRSTGFDLWLDWTDLPLTDEQITRLLRGPKLTVSVPVKMPDSTTYQDETRYPAPPARLARRFLAACRRARLGL